jgi:hypothetical protein
MRNRELFPSWVFGIASKIWEGSLPAEYPMRSVFWALVVEKGSCCKG